MPACCGSQDCCSQCPDPETGHCRPMPPPETPGHSQAGLAQPLVGSLLLSPGSWCAQGFVCAFEESVSPVLWKFGNQILLASKVKFPGGSQSLFQIPRLGNMLWGLELLQQCKNLFDLIVLQFVSCLPSGSMEAPHKTRLPGLLQPEPQSLGSCARACGDRVLSFNASYSRTS